MFINCTNHRLSEWSAEQVAEAEKWGEIVEYPFPNVSPHDSGDDVKRKAKEIVLEIAGKAPQAVMVQGEMTMTFAIVSELKKLNIYTLSAVSERIVKISADENGNTIKTSEFHFAGFREY